MHKIKAQLENRFKLRFTLDVTSFIGIQLDIKTDMLRLHGRDKIIALATIFEIESL